MSEQFKISGKAYWAKVTKADENGKFTMDISTSPDVKTNLKSLGIKVKNKDKEDAEFNEDPANKGKQRIIRGDYVSLTSKFAPKIFGRDGTTEITNTLIGNGSDVNVAAEVFEWVSPSGKKGKSLGLRKIQIVNLIEYKNKINEVSFDSLEGSSEGDDGVPF